jgi:hypothetical protein
MDSARWSRRTKLLAVVAVGLQWLLLTIALGTIIVYTDQSMEGLLGYQLNGGYAFFGAALIGFLMGATIERSPALVTMVIASCAGGAGIYVAVLFLPVWTGTLVHTVGLENFATTRAMLYFGLAAVPVSLGAMAGRLLATTIPGGDLLNRRRNDHMPRWWLDRNASEEARQEASRPQ